MTATTPHGAAPLSSPQRPGTPRAVGIPALRAAIPVRRPDFLRGPRVPTPLHARPVPTARLLLRPYAMSDADDWFRIQSSPEILRFLPWPRRSRRASRTHLRHRTRHTRLCYDGDFLALAVTRDDRVIGDVSLHLRGTDPATFGVEIGWLLHPAHTGNGYAFEAASALLRLADEALGAHWALAEIHAENTASLRLAERLGFTRVSETPADILRLIRPRP
ncbi:GNAT family N-acetyltransferase [Microbacterium resistens]|uniref:GNAT family N-acetyltransferase n=1 Tax=Microbacterium resistens TaxID=156977 RepID=A0ABY3RMG4_9MICO|nr:GNAT family N-acetyltransferase [Microbacterium resistens]UGS24988.1 GNAT family N-acetyltransferase [Microbacterium resistens]